MLTAEIVRASRTLTQLVQPHKINIAALGNVVPQLHVHVIARFTDDPAWPKAVWGTVPPEPYAAVELQQRVTSFQRALADPSPGSTSQICLTSAAKRRLRSRTMGGPRRRRGCRKDTGVIDETPAAYKDIDAVMAAQSDLVEVVHTLKQVLCVKG